MSRFGRAVLGAVLLAPALLTQGLSGQEPTAQELAAQDRAAAVRPNVLVLMADDWSWPHAGFLGDQTARTPHLDALAAEGVVFEQAFVAAPSCTPSRFAIATGQWPWRLGEAGDLGGSLAAGVPVYPECLEAGGYRIGFARKGAEPSDHTHRRRDPFGPRFRTLEQFLEEQPGDAPFCFWYGAGEPHRPYRFGEGERAGFDPAAVTVPGFLPDHEVVRRDLCDYHHRIRRFDDDVGRMLAALEEAGLRANTLVVVAGDNGMPFPRAKATVYDSGIRVPLVIHGPGVRGGRRVDDVVSLIDLAPTFLASGACDIPEAMTGRSLWPQLRAESSGRIDAERSFTLAGMERHVFLQPSRALRTDRFLYIRAFELGRWPAVGAAGTYPELDHAAGQWLAEPRGFPRNVDQSPTLALLLQGQDDPGLRPAFERAFGVPPAEELYVLAEDPEQLRDVAGDEAYAGPLKRLRARLDAALRASGDPRAPRQRRTAAPVRQERVDYNHPPRAYVDRALGGWTVHVEEELLEQDAKLAERALARLQKKLGQVEAVLPPSALAELQDVELFVMFGAKARGGGRSNGLEFFRRSMPQHYDWIDPRMARSIVIFDAENWIRLTEFWALKALLHEFAHAHHLGHWPELHPPIHDAWSEAMAAGRYQTVREEDARSFNPNYAAQNHLEYFAELSAMYFVGCNYFPRDRNALRGYDPEGFALIERLWGIRPSSKDR